MLGAIPIIADNRIRAAMEQEEFENLAGTGQPLRDHDDDCDPNWWLMRKLQREELTAVDTRPQRNS